MHKVVLQPDRSESWHQAKSGLRRPPVHRSEPDLSRELDQARIRTALLGRVSCTQNTVHEHYFEPADLFLRSLRCRLWVCIRTEMAGCWYCNWSCAPNVRAHGHDAFLVAAEIRRPQPDLL